MERQGRALTWAGLCSVEMDVMIMQVAGGETHWFRVQGAGFTWTRAQSLHGVGFRVYMDWGSGWWDGGGVHA